MIRSNPANFSEDVPGIVAECFARRGFKTRRPETHRPRATRTLPKMCRKSLRNVASIAARYAPRPVQKIFKGLRQGFEGLQLEWHFTCVPSTGFRALRFGWLPLFGCVAYRIGFGFVHCFWSSLVDPPACPFSILSDADRSMFFNRPRSHVRKNIFCPGFARPHPGVFSVLGTLHRRIRGKKILGKVYRSISPSASDHQLPGWRGCRTSGVLARKL